jgi:hypothetical protein
MADSEQLAERASAGAGDGAGTVAMRSLGPDAQLEQLQKMLKEYSSSDDVRNILLSQLFKVSSIPVPDVVMTAAHLVDTPFFTIGGLERKSVRENANMPVSMSGSISSVTRAVLKEYYAFNVGFVEWKNFTNDMREKGIEEQALKHSISWYWDDHLRGGLPRQEINRQQWSLNC